MLSRRGLSAGFAVLGLAFVVTSFSHAGDILKAKLYPDKKGTIADFQPMSKFCGTKPITVAYSDGWGGNYWRHLARAEFEDEASKCKNITDAATPTASSNLRSRLRTSRAWSRRSMTSSSRNSTAAPPS